MFSLLKTYDEAFGDGIVLETYFQRIKEFITLINTHVVPNKKSKTVCACILYGTSR